MTIFMLIAVASVAKPTVRSHDEAKTSQLFLAFIGPFISALYLGIVLVTALLPLTPMGHVLIKSVEQGAAATR